jgi:probable DNA repair protein
VILTANQRLARTLRKSHDDQQVAAGHLAWPSPSILPFGTWLRARWLDAVLAGAVPPLRLLNAAQEETVWQRVIAESPSGDSILDVRGTAASAIEAWRLAQQYRIPLDGRFAAHEDWAAFHFWAGEYSKRSTGNGWTDEARLPDAVLDAIQKRGFEIPTVVKLAGFDEFTPQQKDVLAALEQAGCEIESLAPDRAEGATVQCACPNADEELRSAARWAADKHQSDRRASIGIVLLSAGASRTRLERILDEALPGAYHISMGEPLARYPMVSAALLALRLAGMSRWPMADAGRLLRSTFIRGGIDEAPARALFDARLRRWRRAYVSPGAVTALAEVIERWRARNVAAPRPPSQWAVVFAGMLEDAGWPGDRALSSAEYQVRQAWGQLLRTFSSLDAASEKLLFESAVVRLSELAAGTEFQPEDTGALVQILGPLEAAGARFDHLWICGADDSTWPAPAHPHPFLPLSIQREQRLPHSSPDREFEFAVRIFARLRASATQVIVSWPQQAGDVELRPSPLLAGVPHVAGLDTDTGDRPYLPVETVGDETAPPLGTTQPRGGTQVLRLQSACPFRAFADLRLGARPMDGTEIGLSPADRGRTVHKALEMFWDAVHDHAALVALSPPELTDTARRAATGAVRYVMREAPDDFDKRLRDLETARLTSVLVEWAGVERTRAPFQVAFSERERVVGIGGLALSARMDRVDHLPDGRQVIIDYKTNAPSVAAWSGDRPDEPQVPLYAISNEADVAAVAFAQVGSAGLRFRGFAANDRLLPGVKVIALADQVTEWRRILEPIARAFRDGIAAADPKNGSATCNECKLTSLCRIHEVFIEEA